MNDALLDNEDFEAILRVVTRCEEAESVRDLSEVVVGALSEELGLDRSFLIVTVGPEGAVRGISGYEAGLDYVAAPAKDDPIFSDPAEQMLRRHGVLSLEQVVAELGLEPGPRFREILDCLKVQTWVTVWLDTGMTAEGFLVVVSDRKGRFGEHELEVLRLLRPHVTNHLRRTILHPSSDVLLEPLSEREAEVARLVASGHTNREIANRLAVGVPTVKKHVTRTLQKTGLPNRTALAVAIRHPQQVA